MIALQGIHGLVLHGHHEAGPGQPLWDRRWRGTRHGLVNSAEKEGPIAAWPGPLPRRRWKVGVTGRGCAPERPDHHRSGPVQLAAAAGNVPRPCTSLGLLARRFQVFGRNRIVAHQYLGPCKVGRRVNADGFSLGADQGDGKPVLDHPQHVDGLDDLERRLR